MLPEPGPEFIRHYEGQQKIGDWQELGCLPLDPLLAFKMLAVRAAAMPTGMGNLDRFLAVRTLHHHQIAALLTATGHCLQGLTMTGEHFMAMGSLQFGLIASD